jgi:hypothetical protein
MIPRTAKPVQLSGGETWFSSTFILLMVGNTNLGCVIPVPTIQSLFEESLVQTPSASDLPENLDPKQQRHAGTWLGDCQAEFVAGIGCCQRKLHYC